jgi:hypothetical protein
MARPKKNYEDLRIHQVNIRLTDAELEFSKKQSQLTGLAIAHWLRKSALSKKPLVMKVSPMHRAYYRQLVGLSNNINQISHKINQGQYTKIHDELKTANELLRQINQLFLRNDSETD